MILNKGRATKSPLLNTDLSILDLSVWIYIKDKKVNLITL